MISGEIQTTIVYCLHVRMLIIHLATIVWMFGWI